MPTGVLHSGAGGGEDLVVSGPSGVHKAVILSDLPAPQPGTSPPQPRTVVGLPVPPRGTSPLSPCQSWEPWRVDAERELEGTF